MNGYLGSLFIESFVVAEERFAKTQQDSGVDGERSGRGHHNLWDNVQDLDSEG